MEWEAWYTGGRRYASPAWDPDELPTDGLLGIVKYLDRTTRAGKPYRHILSGDDRYFWWRGEWFSNSDPVEEIEARYPGALIVRGQWVPTEEMDRVRREMQEAQEPPGDGS